VRTGKSHIHHVAGLRLNVRQTGDGPPVLLINGLGAHTSMWGALERNLTGMRLISYDSPGVGGSPSKYPPPSIKKLADVLVKLLDQLALPQVDVLGYSFGGAVAQQLAYRYPDRVRRLVLTATLPGWGSVLGEPKSVALAYNPLRYLSRSLYESTIGDLAGGQARTSAAFRAQQSSHRLTQRPKLLAYYCQIATLTTWSSLPWLGEIAVPTLVVTGDDDPLVPPANSYLLAQRIEGARLLVVPDEGHLLLLDEHGQAHEPLREFFSSPKLDDSTTWNRAAIIDKNTSIAAARQRGIGAAPWAQLSTFSRRLLLRSPGRR
jgi:pimeloyl-ACP methyl ester carboxylesterase